MCAAAIIVAGGKGSRMGGAIKKQYLPLAGIPILSRTLLKFDACEAVQEIVLAAPEADMAFCRAEIISCCRKRVTLVAGGAERQESVYNGLLAVENSLRIVTVHDGVRPFITPEQITSCIREARRSGACIIATPVTDTLKRAESSGMIRETVERKNLWMAQTPQAFLYRTIRDAHEAARRDGYRGTDDAGLVERIGKQVKIIPGDPGNIKITIQAELALAEAVLAAEKGWRVTTP